MGKLTAKMRKELGLPRYDKLPKKLTLIEQAMGMLRVNPNLDLEQTCQLLQCDVETVRKALKELGIDPSTGQLSRVKAFREARADILAAKQMDILENVTADKMDKAGLKELASAFAVLHDHERLELGQSTTNVDNSVMVLIKEVQSGHKGLLPPPAEVIEAIVE